MDQVLVNIPHMFPHMGLIPPSALIVRFSRFSFILGYYTLHFLQFPGLLLISICGQIKHFSLSHPIPAQGSGFWNISLKDFPVSYTTFTLVDRILPSSISAVLIILQRSPSGVLGMKIAVLIFLECFTW